MITFPLSGKVWSLSQSGTILQFLFYDYPKSLTLVGKW